MLLSLLVPFQSYKVINPINVKLPDGHFAFAKHIETVLLSSYISIKDLLYLSDFSINLISVSKLCQNSKFIVSFTNTNYFNHDQMSMKMIGLANKC